MFILLISVILSQLISVLDCNIKTARNENLLSASNALRKLLHVGIDEEDMDDYEASMIGGVGSDMGASFLSQRSIDRKCQTIVNLNDDTYLSMHLSEYRLRFCFDRLDFSASLFRCRLGCVVLVRTRKDHHKSN